MTPCYPHLFPFSFFHLTLYSVVHSIEEGRHIPHSFVAATKHSSECISNPCPSDEHLHHFQSFALIIIASIIVLQKTEFFFFFAVFVRVYFCKIEVKLIYNAVLVSGVWQSDSVILT